MEYYFYVTIFNVYGKDIRVLTTFKNSSYKNINIQAGDEYTIKTTVENMQKVIFTAFDGKTFKAIKLNNTSVVEISSNQIPNKQSILYVEQRPSSKPTATEAATEAPSTKTSAPVTTDAPATPSTEKVDIG